MFTLIPYRRYLSNPSGIRNSFMNDPFFRSFMNMNESLGSNGFRVDIREQDNAYLLEAELPGVSEENISLTVDGDVLTISADISSETKDEQQNYYYSERRTGHVERSFNLEGIDQDGITANCKNGILYVDLPKAKPVPDKTVRKIQINTAPKLEDSKGEVEKE